MRAMVTGQVGVEKGPFLEALRTLAVSSGIDLHVCHVGQMMYAEAPDVPAGRILNLPMTRLNTLRRSVFKEILRFSETHEHVIVNTHATFRWRHGLFAAFDFDQVKAFNADNYITLLDNLENVHHRLLRDHDLEHTLKDIMVWREEELLATEILANILRGYGRFHMIGRGKDLSTAETIFRLLFRRELKTVYLSFPMSHVMDLPDTQAEIQRFKLELREHLTCFDPGDVDEFSLHSRALAALADGQNSIGVQTSEGLLTIKCADVTACSADILGQIYARDFKMIDQSDLIVSYVPELPSAKPGISSGVERELQHAFEGGKEVYVIWASKTTPSPFVTQTATRVFASTSEAIEFFRNKGYIKPSSR